MTQSTSTTNPAPHPSCDDSGSAWPYPKIILHALIASLVMVAALLLWHVTAQPAPTLDWMVMENGALENIQATLLAATFIVGWVAAFRTEISRWRTIAIAIACVALAGWAREIQSTPTGDLAESSASTIGFTLNRSLKHGLMLAAGLVFVGRAIQAWFHYPLDRPLWFTPRFIWPAVPFAGCFLLAEWCEESQLVLVEEAAEIFGYSMLLLCTAWIVRHRSACSATTSSAGTSSIGTPCD